jgi:putative hydrolase of HD superfamily
MHAIADLLFESRALKSTPRSGFPFLGVGSESVAEHVYHTAFIAFVMSKLEPAADGLKLLSLCLVHDLPEARTGDLNTVNKKYVNVDEQRALTDALAGIPFGGDVSELLEEFNQAQTLEARLARDADQVALVVELKDRLDAGFPSPKDWLPNVLDRLQTETGRRLADAVVAGRRDRWWRKDVAS